MEKFPKIKSVKPLENQILLLTFQNNVEKKYDCSKLIQKYSIFKSLLDNAFFKNVNVDTGGYGIYWNSEIDISESELWNNGEMLIKQNARAT